MVCAAKAALPSFAAVREFETLHALLGSGLLANHEWHIHSSSTDSHTITAQFYVTRTRGTPHHFIDFIRRYMVAWAFMRLCIRISSTYPVASTARQSQCLRPRIEITISSRCHLSAGTGQSRKLRANR